jgi:hypothetical protein
MRKQRLDALRVLSAMGVTLASVLFPVVLGLGVASSSAGAAIPLQCRTSQLSISVAPSYTNLHSRNRIVNITFTNNSRTCELRGEVPGVVTVVGTKHTPVGHDVTVFLPYIAPVVLTLGKSSISSLIVIRSIASAKGCLPVTTDGLVISTAVRGNSPRYVHYIIHGVCSSAAHPNLMLGIFNKSVA